MTHNDRLEYLRVHGDRGDYIRYFASHHRLRRLSDAERCAFVTDAAVIIDAIFDRAETLARQNLLVAFTHSTVSEAGPQ